MDFPIAKSKTLSGLYQRYIFQGINRDHQKGIKEVWEWTRLQTSQSEINDGTSEQTGRVTNSEGILRLHPGIRPINSEAETLQDIVQEVITRLRWWKETRLDSCSYEKINVISNYQGVQHGTEFWQTRMNRDSLNKMKQKHQGRTYC